MNHQSIPASTVSNAVAARHACRAFLDKPVSTSLVKSLREKASRAPSGGNLQPCQVYALTGESLAQLIQTVQEKLARGERESGDYEIYPPKLWEPLRSRRREAGEQRYAALRTAREANGQETLELLNFQFFGAPVALFFCLDRRVGPPQWADVGMYMQTLMLLAVEQGLATCPQEIWSTWPRTVAQFAGIPDQLMLFAAMALGYEDTGSTMNSYRTPRAQLDNFATFIGFEEIP